MTSKIILSRHLRFAFALLLFLAHGIVNATMHTISGSNFTMLDQNGALVPGGATDVFGEFDDTKICTSESCTDFAMTLASNQPFLGVMWTAHNIRVFSEGTYKFDTDCTGADIAAGITDCGDGPYLSLTVGPGQLGAHMLFDYPPSTNIDVAILWDFNSAFGSPIYNATDATQTPTTVWNLASKDGNGDGIRGIPMVDGPFPDFNANFNLNMAPPFTPNTPPVANNNAAGTTPDTPVLINVVANDTDAEDGSPPPVPPAVVTITSNPANGGAVNNNDGTVTYTPNAGYTGPDSFQYTLTDSGGAVSNTATVSITVSASANNPPVANDTTLATDEDTPLAIQADSVATDPDGDSLTFATFDASSAQGGTIVKTTTAELTYTPAANFNGQDSFKFSVNDGIADSNIATITVTVNPVNDPVVCTDVSFNTDIGTALAIDVAADLLSTCTDADNDTITLDSVSQPAQPGSMVTYDGVNTVTYTPEAGFSGQDSFTYTATDGTAVDTRTVAVDVGKIFGNFTMIDAGSSTFGGTNDIVATWDGTLNNSVTSTNFNMTISSDSNFPFFGFPWFAHDIRVFGPGSYAFDTTCSVAQLQSGVADCGGTPDQYLHLDVPVGEMGAHVLFDWNITKNIDVALLWESNAPFINPNPAGALYLGPAGPTPATDCSYQLVSRDVDGDTIPGAKMIDGPFINFQANFNINLDRGCTQGTVVAPETNVKSPNLGSGGCTVASSSTSPFRRGDLLLIIGFIAWLGFITGHRRRRPNRRRPNE
jgi:Bacterial Ig domain/Cadherin-like domain